MTATTKPYVPAAAGTAAIRLLDLQDQVREIGEAVTGLSVEQLAALDWGDVGSLEHGLAKARELNEWLTAWRAAQ